MKLTRFKVTNFRSVADSGWIEVDAVTALIGVNESGKTNLLLPLWKLNPARDGEIQATSDYPKTMFGQIRAEPGKYPFITAEFTTDDAAERIARTAGIAPEAARIVEVTRFFDGSYLLRFPEYTRETTEATQWVREQLNATVSKVRAANALKQEASLQHALVDGISRAAAGLPEKETICSEQLEALRDHVAGLIPEKPAKTSAIVPMVQQLVKGLALRIQRLSAPDSGDVPDVFQAVLSAMPKFVYYSNYGNLDSEIYLPHVVENLERDDLGESLSSRPRVARKPLALWRVFSPAGTRACP